MLYPPRVWNLFHSEASAGKFSAAAKPALSLSRVPAKIKRSFSHHLKTIARFTSSTVCSRGSVHDNNKINFQRLNNHKFKRCCCYHNTQLSIIIKSLLKNTFSSNDSPTRNDLLQVHVFVVTAVCCLDFDQCSWSSC